MKISNVMPSRQLSFFHALSSFFGLLLGFIWFCDAPMPIDPSLLFQVLHTLQPKRVLSVPLVIH